MTTEPEADLPEPPDPTTWAVQERRVRVRRWVALNVGVALLLVTLAVGWKVGMHCVASGWLDATGCQVDWGPDEGGYWRGGMTSVKLSRSNWSWVGRRADLDLRGLPYLHRVREFDLASTYSLTDGDVAFLSEYPSLTSLNLDQGTYQGGTSGRSGQLTDATLARIKAFRQIRTLRIGGQQVTDAGLANLDGLDRLETLSLRMTGITDAGLARLEPMLPALKELDVEGTDVTAAGIKRFEAARPGVQVEADARLRPLAGK